MVDSLFHPLTQWLVGVKQGATIFNVTISVLDPDLQGVGCEGGGEVGVVVIEESHRTTILGSHHRAVQLHRCYVCLMVVVCVIDFQYGKLTISVFSVESTKYFNLLNFYLKKTHVV